MTTGEILILVLMAIMTVLYIFLNSYLKKRGENLATKDDIQEISRLSKKGENLATKEDIKEITKLAESIKSEVSLESQRWNDYIEQRTELFLSILKYAEEIDKCGLLMRYYVQAGSADEQIDSLIQRVKDITTTVGYNQNLLVASNKNPDIADMIQLLELTQVILKYGAAICEYGARAMSIISRIKRNIDLYKNCNQDQRFMDIAEVAMNQLADLQKEPTPRSKYHDELTKKDNEYIQLLYKFYNKDFNIYLNYNQPPQ